MIIVESDNFVLENHPKPEVSRSDGGHITINPKVRINDRTLLSPDQVIELALLTNVAGKAMKDGLAERGIMLGRINYQDNGNWNKELHVHLYGRAYAATYQVYGSPIKTANSLEEKVPQEPLTEEDCMAIRKKALEYGSDLGYESLRLR